MRKLFRILFLFLLFVLYEVAVWIGASYFFPGSEPLLLFVMTVLALTVFVVYWLVSRAHKSPEPEPAWHETPVTGAEYSVPDTGQEDGDFKALLERAEEQLAQSPKLPQTRIRPSLSDFPLYILVGVEGTQPGEFIEQSGLEHDLLATLEQTGFETTPECRIWFAEQVVFAEVSAAVFDEKERWQRLLRLLGPEKGILSVIRNLWTGGAAAQNLRGVILTLDASRFQAQPDPQALSGLIKTVRNRLDAVGALFRTNFPVFVLLSESEQLSGFDQFFARINSQEEAQILGCSLSLAGSEEHRRRGGELYKQRQGKRLSQAFDRLRRSLSAKRIDLLPREEVVEKRGEIYEFPRKLGRIRDVLISFLVAVFQPNPLRPNPLLRGFYFTGRREAEIGLPGVSDSRTESMSAAAGMESGATMLLRGSQIPKEGPPPQRSTAMRWCFLSDLFQQLVRPNLMFTGGGFVNQRIRTYRYAALGTATCLLLLLCFVFIRSGYHNSGMLSALEGEVQASEDVWREHRNLDTESLEALEVIRQRVVQLTEYQRDGAPWRMRWGLYSGDDVWMPLRDRYFREFDHYFLQEILGTLTQTLAQPDDSAPVANHLKAYRMLTEQKCEPNRSFLKDELARVWRARWSAAGREADLSEQQINYYAQELERENPYQLEENDRLVERAQDYLQQLGGADQAYQQLLAEVRQDTAGLPAMGPNAAEVLDFPPTVSPEFTLEGWEKMRQRLESLDDEPFGEPCVFGYGGTIERGMQSLEIQAKLKEMYLQDYAEAWKKFLSQTKVKNYRSRADAAAKLEILADIRSPLLDMLKTVGHQTDLRNTLASGRIESQAGGLLRKAREIVAGSSSEEQVEGPGWSVERVQKIFQPARAVVDPGKETLIDPELNGAYMSALLRLQQTIDRLSRSRESSPDYRGLIDDADGEARKAKTEAASLTSKFLIDQELAVDVEVKRLLLEPVDQVAPYTIAPPGPGDQLNTAFVRLCRQFRPLRNKYPFNPRAQSEVTLRELSSVFNFEDGAVWRFYNDHFSKVLVLEGDQYIQNPGQPEPALTENFLHTFSRLAAISNALFADSLGSPRMSYRLRPQPHPVIDRVTITLDGSVLESSSDRPRTGSFSWPGAQGSQQAELRVTLKGTDHSIPFGSYEGLWAVFRMMQDADSRASGSPSVQFSQLKHAQPILSPQGQPLPLTLEILDFPGGVPTAFDSTFFSSVDCSGNAVQ